MVERLLIARLGHRGDGVADGAGRRDLRSRRAARRNGRGRSRSPAIPTAAGCFTSNGRARSASRRSARISAYAAAAPCSTGKRRGIARGSAISWSTRCGRPDSTRRSPNSSTRTAKAAAARSSMPGAARTACSKSAFPPRAPIIWSRSTAARCWRQSLDGAIKAAWAIAETARSGEQAARHPCHRDRCRPRRRRARLGAADGGADDRAGAHRRRRTISRGSPATAS